jgi:hypothetical protein
MQTNATTPPTQPSSAPQPDLAALQQLDDAELWVVAEGEMSAGDITRLQWLLEENADNALGASERAELAARVAAAEQFAQRREYAAAILAQRRPPMED